MSEQSWLDYSDITFPLAAGTKLLLNDPAAKPDFAAVRAKFAEVNISGLDLVEEGRTVTLAGACTENDWASETAVKNLFTTLAPIVPDGRYAQFETTSTESAAKAYRLVVVNERVVHDYPRMIWNDPVTLAAERGGTDHDS